MDTSVFFEWEMFDVLVPAETKAVQSVYCADLLSWAMGRAPAGCAWCTVMGNANAIAVASLTEAAVLVLCEGAALDTQAKNKAEQHDIFVVTTRLPAFDAALAIARAAGLYELK